MLVTAARVRTALVAVGFGFVAPALGSACLDFAGEDWGACPMASSSTSSTPASGTGTSAEAPAVDCGAPATTPDSGLLGSGSGSASP